MLLGVLLSLTAGLSVGTSAWPLKSCRKLQVEHWLFIWVLLGVVILPWGLSFALCPGFLTAMRSVAPSVLIRSNLFAIGWGIANVLCSLCMVRIGLVLTGGILGGLGLSLGVLVPMIFKASGLFSNAPDLSSSAGLCVLIGIAVILAGVVLCAAAGFGRDRALRKHEARSGSFTTGLVMVVIAGILSTGPSFAFAYSQGPIVAAMKSVGAGQAVSTFAVWAVGMAGGALVNLVFAAYMITTRRGWHVFRNQQREIAMACMSGIQFFVAFALLGNGMLRLGALGASVGWGIYQAMQISGGQAVGFMSGEWRGVQGTPMRQISAAVALLIAASAIMAYGNSLAPH